MQQQRLAALGLAVSKVNHDLRNMLASVQLFSDRLAGLEDPTILEKRTGVAQVVELPYSGSDIGWAVPYVKRFPNANLSALIARAPWVRYTTWGGAPPD